MAGAARITAAYDDTPLLHRFPAAGGGAVTGFDLEALRETLVTALGALCGMSATIDVSPLPVAPRGLGWLARGDGLAAACGGGAVLAGALLSRDCGGGFVASDVPPASASLARRRADLMAAIRDAVGTLWPDGETGWTVGAAPAAYQAWHVAVTVGGVADSFDLALVPPPHVAADHGDWPRQLHARLAALAIPVRVVLHEGPYAVRAARALRVGDVLPLVTAHEVGIRAGRLCIARGRSAGTSEDAARVEIVRRGSR